jgi:hypothetical protein
MGAVKKIVCISQPGVIHPHRKYTSRYGYTGVSVADMWEKRKYAFSQSPFIASRGYECIVVKNMDKYGQGHINLLLTFTYAGLQNN